MRVEVSIDFTSSAVQLSNSFEFYTVDAVFAKILERYSIVLKIAESTSQ